MKGKIAAVAALAGGAAWGAYSHLRRPKPLEIDYSDAPTKILMVGGGFGGLAAARGLVRAFGGSHRVGVGLLDKVNYTTFYPMVPRGISSNVEVRHVAHSIRRILTPLGVKFFQAEVEGVDFEAREVHSDTGTFSYDYLILAPGSRTAFFDTPGVQKHAIDLKGLRETLQVRNHIIDRIEEAERLRGRFSDDLLTFIFVGGGPTGVEGLAYSHELIFDVLKPDYPNVNFDRVRLVLVNAGERILKGIDPSLANAAIRRLASQKVEIINNTKVTEIRPDSVGLSGGRTIAARTKVWAAGVEPPPLVKGLKMPKDSRGNILVDEFLRVKDLAGVYAAGDCISIEDRPPIPALAQSAEQEGKLAARNLAAEIRGEALIPFSYRSLGNLVDLGTTSSLTDILGVRFSGLLGELVWKGVYLYELGYNINRARVLTDWTVDFFTRPDTSKLFED